VTTGGWLSCELSRIASLALDDSRATGWATRASLTGCQREKRLRAFAEYADAFPLGLVRRRLGPPSGAAELPMWALPWHEPDAGAGTR